MTATVTLTKQGETDLVLTRSFRAPRQLVFDAHTKPELLQRWLGVRNGWTFPVCEVDLRVGGKYRWVWRKEAKNLEMVSSGTFREIDQPARLVFTEKFDWHDGESLVTNAFDEEEGITTLTMVMSYQSREVRDQAGRSGMETGLEESYEKLDRMLEKP
jgi:uncharacterized protein YndB with AHSA1/START domain